MPRLVGKLPQKTAEDLELLRIDYSRKIGGQRQGDVYLAKARFRKGRAFWVAAKIYRHPLRDEQIPHYEGAIRILEENGIPHLKAGFVRHEGKWVMLSHAYSRRGRTIAKDAFLTNFAGGMMPISTVKCDAGMARKYLDVLSSFFNLGFDPAFDSILCIRSKSIHFKVGDYDQLAAQVRQKDPQVNLAFTAWMHLHGLQLDNEADRPELAGYFLRKLSDGALRAEIRKELKMKHPDWPIGE